MCRTRATHHSEVPKEGSRLPPPRHLHARLQANGQRRPIGSPAMPLFARCAADLTLARRSCAARDVPLTRSHAAHMPLTFCSPATRMLAAALQRPLVAETWDTRKPPWRVAEMLLGLRLGQTSANLGRCLAKRGKHLTNVDQQLQMSAKHRKSQAEINHVGSKMATSGPK